MASATHDLLIITDATASMGTFLTGLNEAIPEILALSTMSGAFQRIGVAAYRDYCDSDLYEWSGWNSPTVAEFGRSLRPSGGGDHPEAAKTALIKALDELIDPSRHTVILWYADAPPHHPSQERHNHSSNPRSERLAFPNRTTDWIDLSYEARDKNCTVFSFVETTDDMYKCYYILLSDLTGGTCVVGNARRSSDISRCTLDVLLTWMGNPPVDSDAPAGNANWSRVVFDQPPPKEKGSQTEIDCNGYLTRVSDSNLPWGQDWDGPTIRNEPLTFTPNIIRPGKVQISNTTLARRFLNPAQAEYRSIVYSSLSSIITHNVFAMTYNPIFGQLWRAVCKYRAPDGGVVLEREELVNQFSQQVGKITDPARAKEMKDWLEDSYDSTEAIEEIIRGAPQDANTQHMYLDLDSFGADGVNLTRIEMLEISRSCAAPVVANLAQIFTHTKLVEPGTVLAPGQRSIPLSLPPKTLFQIMPHLVVPGTMFSARPSLMMAILATIVGVPFLLEPAATVLSATRGCWVDLEVPENLSYEFARFMLQGDSTDVAARLTESELATYSGMRKYKLLELNLDASVTAKVGWTPSKSRELGDDRVVCTKCEIPRSKTMMSNNPQFAGICGICSASSLDPKSLNEPDEKQACWVECSVRTCRAQYVVANPAALKVRPKCWYCRNATPCPFVECTRCFNRVIMPGPYQKDLDQATYLCIGCSTSSRETIVGAETTTRQLVSENEVAWLGVKATPDTFSNKSAFKMAQAQTPAFFQLSVPSAPAAFTLLGKKILDGSEVVQQIFARVDKGTVELGTCTLCFENAPHSTLRAACGRTGCAQRVDEECQRAWYGANKPGLLLNLMQLTCPFCRRIPATKTLAKFNAQAAALGGLKEALADRGWYYAWCEDCGFAKRAVERACCDGDRLPNIDHFCCEQCEEHRRQHPQPQFGQSIDTAGPKVVACPTCEVYVEKTVGCNHITCQCGTHFCFVCGVKATEDTIYDHMAQEHGGIYDEEEEDEDEVDE